jgi:hypothetical protein
MNRDRFETVRAWHEAVNRGDADAVVALTHDDVEVGGPRGSARGSALLRDWLARAGIQLEPRRWFVSSTELVVEQIATWRSPDGTFTDPQTIATSFFVERGVVTRAVRYDSLMEALAAGGLTLQDEIPSGTGEYPRSRDGKDLRP